MASAYKILGQSRPANTSVATLYTVPASTAAVISTITATNLTGTPTDIDIYVVAPSGSATTSNALVFEAELVANTTIGFTFGLTLQAASSLQVKSSAGSAITFQAFGQEIS